VDPIQRFKELLRARNISAVIQGEEIICSHGKKKFVLPLNVFNRSLILHSKEKLSSVIRSKLGLNRIVFARNCKVKAIDKLTASSFLDTYHLMNSTQSAFNYGLFHKEDLIAVASFSKGRKMNRLPEDMRSFEMIRFCCKEGITVTGGLTKLVKNFCKEKHAGDVMTYIDKQFSSGASFIRAGFMFHSETSPNYFLVNKKTLEITACKNPEEKFDTEKFQLFANEGNIKLIYTHTE
jgi:hypothetical protein